jgi:hypothetical protein
VSFCRFVVIFKKENKKFLVVVLVIVNRFNCILVFSFSLLWFYFLIVFSLVLWCILTLSGTHGSWTMSDDVDQPDRHRMHREARNHLHHRPGQARANAQNAHRRVHGNHVNDNNNPIPPDIPAPPEIIFRRKFIHVTNFPLFHDASRYYAQPVWEVMPPGFYDVYDYGPGWAEVPDGPMEVKKIKRVVVVDAMGEYRIGEYWHGSTYVPTDMCFLPRALVEPIRKLLKPCDANESILKTIDVKCRTLLLDVPEVMIGLVVRYFIEASRHSLYRISTLGKHGFTNRNIYTVLDLGDDHEAEFDEQHGHPFKIPSIQCTVQPQYHVRRGITLNGEDIRE